MNCTVPDCGVYTPPERPMCPRHWFPLPKKLRGVVLRECARSAREPAAHPTPRYLSLVFHCAAWVMFKPGDAAATKAAAELLARSEAARFLAVLNGDGDVIAEVVKP